MPEEYIKLIEEEDLSPSKIGNLMKTLNMQSKKDVKFLIKQFKKNEESSNN